jgi:hypothetical protein
VSCAAALHTFPREDHDGKIQFPEIMLILDISMYGKKPLAISSKKQDIKQQWPEMATQME